MPTNNSVTAGALVSLIDLMKRLRRECPWDRDQTHDSLRPYMVEEAYEAVVLEAQAIISAVTDDPKLFADIARQRSDCSSGKDGGCLGQVTRGQTLPEFETFLFALEEGQLSPVPVKTRYGIHVLRLDRRIAGRTLPFDLVKTKIADFLAEASWRLAVSQYIKILAGRAEIIGVDLAGTDSPLVQ